MRRALVAFLCGILLLPGTSALAGCTKAGPFSFGQCPTNNPSSPSGSSGGGSKTFRSDAARAKEMVRLINKDRSRRGLTKLEVDVRLQRVAQRHAERMAKAGDVWHNGQLMSRSGRRSLGNPRAIGENVGMGKGPAAVHRGFMKSRSHKANVVRPVFRQVGVGVVKRGGIIYVSEVFARMRGGTVSSGGGSAVAPAKPESREQPPAAPPVSEPEAAAPEPGSLVAEPEEREFPIAAIVLALLALAAVARPFRRPAPRAL